MDEDQGGQPSFGRKPNYLLGAGIAAGLFGGGFLIFREIQKYIARKKAREAREDFEQMQRDLLAGKLTPAAAFAKIMASPIRPDGTKKVLNLPDPKLLCSVVFPFSPEVIAAIPGMADNLAALKRNGDCL